METAEKGRGERSTGKPKEDKEQQEGEERREGKEELGRRTKERNTEGGGR